MTDMTKTYIAFAIIDCREDLEDCKATYKITKSSKTKEHIKLLKVTLKELQKLLTED